MVDIYTLPENLKRIRRNAGLTQEQLAMLIHVSTPTIARYEHGESYPPIDRLYDMAHVMGVNVEEFLRKHI